jgi:DNA-directed RNA polymerase specialized sigma24 family protein
VPETELQALMEAEPHQEPALSKDIMGAAVDDLLQGLDLSALSEEELAALEVTVFAGHSVRNAAKILGWHKSTVHRLKQSALRVIRQQLEEQ